MGPMTLIRSPVRALVHAEVARVRERDGQESSKGGQATQNWYQTRGLKGVARVKTLFGVRSRRPLVEILRRV